MIGTPGLKPSLLFRSGVNDETPPTFFGKTAALKLSLKPVAEPRCGVVKWLLGNGRRQSRVSKGSQPALLAAAAPAGAINASEATVDTRANVSRVLMQAGWAEPSDRFCRPKIASKGQPADHCSLGSLISAAAQHSLRADPRGDPLRDVAERRPLGQPVHRSPRIHCSTCRE